MPLQATVPLHQPGECGYLGRGRRRRLQLLSDTFAFPAAVQARGAAQTHRVGSQPHAGDAGQGLCGLASGQEQKQEQEQALGSHPRRGLSIADSPGAELESMETAGLGGAGRGRLPRHLCKVLSGGSPYTCSAAGTEGAARFSWQCRLLSSASFCPVVAGGPRWHLCWELPVVGSWCESGAAPRVGGW